jgi:hypothetical protein
MDQQLQVIRKGLDSLTDFVRENMLTKQELEEMWSKMPSKADFHQLQSAVDAIAKRFKDTDQEQRVTAQRTMRMERWIEKAAPKIGLPYKP